MCFSLWLRQVWGSRVKGGLLGKVSHGRVKGMLVVQTEHSGLMYVSTLLKIRALSQSLSVHANLEGVADFVQPIV